MPISSLSRLVYKRVGGILSLFAESRWVVVDFFLLLLSMVDDDWASLLDLATHSPYVHLLFYNFLKEDQSLLLKTERELMKMASCCQKCGVTGYEELLIYCRKCRISAEHRYCLDKLPKNTDDVHWFCEQCEPRFSNIDSLEELQIEFDSCPSTSPEQVAGRTLKKRRLILAEEDYLDQEKEIKSGCGKQNASKKALLPSSEPEVQSDCSDGNGRKRDTVPASEPEVQSNRGDRNGRKKVTVQSSGPQLQSDHGDRNGSKKAAVLSSEPKLQSHCGDQNGSERATMPSSEPELQSDHRNGSKKATVPLSEPELLSDHGDRNGSKKTTVPSAEPELQSHRGDQNDNKKATMPSSEPKLQSRRGYQNVSKKATVPSSEPELHSDSGDQNVANKATVPLSEPVFSLLAPHVNSSDEVMIGSRIIVPDTSASQAMVQEEVDVSTVARPISEHVWRGYISFGDEMYGPLRGHLSTLACSKVCNIVKFLPSVLHMEKLSRLDSWPISYKRSPPTGDQIGLYFFPALTMDEPVLDQLLNDAIQKDLSFKLVLDEAELLIFSSTILPKDDDRFLGMYYLWGAFRGRQVPVISSSADHHSTLSELKEENEGDKKGGEGRDEESSDSPTNNFALSPLSVLQHPKLNELTVEIQMSEGLSKHAGQNKGTEAQDEEPCDLEEGEIRDEYVERGEEETFEDSSEDHCLELFPLAVEDMGIVSQVGGSDRELNLELGLSRQSVVNNRGRRTVLNGFL